MWMNILKMDALYMDCFWMDVNGMMSNIVLMNKKKESYIIKWLIYIVALYKLIIKKSQMYLNNLSNICVHYIEQSKEKDF